LDDTAGLTAQCFLRKRLLDLQLIAGLTARNLLKENPQADLCWTYSSLLDLQLIIPKGKSTLKLICAGLTAQISTCKNLICWTYSSALDLQLKISSLQKSYALDLQHVAGLTAQISIRKNLY
jgi:hypothetical protein